MSRAGGTGSGVAVVVVAGGGGRRMGAPTNKIFLPLSGKPILDRTLDAFERMSIVDTVVLVVAPADLAAGEALVRDGGHTKVRRVVKGGSSRHASEYAGLLALADDAATGVVETILVHDAVRPFVTTDRVEALVAAARVTGAAILAIPVGDSLVVVADDGSVQAAGDDLWVAQTPQAFGAALLLDAHRRAAEEGFVATDTAAVVERTDQAVSIVTGGPENIKITTPDDLLRAALIASEIDDQAGSAQLGALTPRI